MTLLPWQLTGGYQLMPHLAAQLALAYRNESGPPVVNRYLSLPATVRYTLTRRPEHRLHFDAVGGVTVLLARNDLSVASFASSIPVVEYRRRTIT